MITIIICLYIISGLIGRATDAVLNVHVENKNRLMKFDCWKNDEGAFTAVSTWNKQVHFK